MKNIVLPKQILQCIHNLIKKTLNIKMDDVNYANTNLALKLKEYVYSGVLITFR